MWMNRYEVEDTRFRFANHPVLARATRFLYEFVEETDANSDGWSSWPLPGRAAGQLMDLIQRGDSATTEAQFQKSLAPIKSFMTRRGYAAGMKFPAV